MESKRALKQLLLDSGCPSKGADVYISEGSFYRVREGLFFFQPEAGWCARWDGWRWNDFSYDQGYAVTKGVKPCKL